MNKKQDSPYYPRDLSWVSFNGRVLQEAADTSKPLMERIKFLAIFSSNLDEFYRVRFSGLKRLSALHKAAKSKHGKDVNALMRKIKSKVTKQQEQFGKILSKDICQELKELGIELKMNNQFDATDIPKLRKKFRDEISKHVKPKIISRENPVFLKEKRLYLFVYLRHKKEGKREYGLLNIPSHKIDRFTTIKGKDRNWRILFLDDIIQHFAYLMFPKHEILSAYSIKMSRDADVPIKDEYAGNLVDKIRKSLWRRQVGLPSRLLYDEKMPARHLLALQEIYNLESVDLIEGDRYHNSSDLMNLPNPDDLIPKAQLLPQWSHPDFDLSKSLIDQILEKDQLAHYPYQSMDPLVALLQDCTLDPRVQKIKISLYRASKKSAILKQIIKAAERGIDVTAFIEVKARFDEKPNLKWAAKLAKNNVRVIYSMPGIKVHCKILSIELLDKKELRHISYLSSGNFNENTAKVYADHALYTAHEGIGFEVARVFDMLAGRLLAFDFKHLLVAPHYLKSELQELIDYEVKQSIAGKEAKIIFKMNSLENKGIINRLIEARDAGVEIDLIVRGICCLAERSNKDANRIRIRSIVGRFLEHARIYFFHHGGRRLLFVGSADLMNRNLNRRVEVLFPVYDPELKDQLLKLLELQLADNVKARNIDAFQSNRFIRTGKEKVNSQMAFYEYLGQLV